MGADVGEPSLGRDRHFYRSLSVGRPDVAREDLTQLAPRSLDAAEQRSLLRSVERCPSARDRAIATMFLYTALRLSELGALDVADLSMSARPGRLKVRLGKGDAYREVPLNSACRAALDEWLIARADQLSKGHAGDHEALWLARSGSRLSTRAIDLVVRRLAADAGLELSAHMLRRTCVTNLVRAGTDVVLVAERPAIAAWPPWPGRGQASSTRWCRCSTRLWPAPTAGPAAKWRNEGGSGGGRCGAIGAAR